jgi:two-component system, OmpR family, sensor histidine kinase KdpD
VAWRLERGHGIDHFHSGSPRRGDDVATGRRQAGPWSLAPSTRSAASWRLQSNAPQFLEERKTGELTRQSEELKTALLASLGHDLRTPLTAIRVAASNMNASWLAPEQRAEQSDVILTETERLTRLFQNILEMARIDAGAVATESRWMHPSEIIAAARDHVEHTLRDHKVAVRIEGDVLVRLDPRLTAAALAHLLDNVAQYAPAKSTIEVHARVEAGDLIVHVQDQWAGIAAADLPHLFERFYRGQYVAGRTSGTGLGLPIARGLLATERGRIWAENTPGGGAQFVPQALHGAATAESRRASRTALAWRRSSAPPSRWRA